MKPSSGIKLKISFFNDTDANSSNLPFAMTASFLGMPIPIMEGNGCDHLSYGSCPALSGHDFTFRMDYQVIDIFPPVKTTLDLLKQSENFLIFIQNFL